MMSRGGRPVVGFGVGQPAPACPACPACPPQDNSPSTVAIAGLLIGLVSLGITCVRINRPA